jgi:protein SCO1
MTVVNRLEAASSGRPKKRPAVAAALALCCLWLVAPLNVSGQATPESHRQHGHAPGPAGENAPRGRSPAKLAIPDVRLLDQNGREVHFYTDLIKGKVVVINFIFTSCAVVCPPLGANFGRVQNMLGERFGRDVYLISVSTDPETDTPARLREWGARFGAKPGWTLVTGEKAELDKVLLALTGDTTRKGAHSAVVLVGSDARGELTQAYGLAPPARLVKLVEDLSGPSTPRQTQSPTGNGGFKPHCDKEGRTNE